MSARIALTLGDVAGIGPEVVARSLLDGRLRDCCRPLVVGHPEVLRRALALIGATVAIRDVASIGEFDWSSPEISCWNPSGVDAASVPAGQIDGRAGRAAYDYLVASTRAALRGEVDAITTAPLNKAALHAAGLDYPGHTEILAQECGVREFAMMLYLPPGERLRGPHGLGVAHVTLHTSIRSVPDLLSTPHITGTIQLVAGFLKRIGCRAPRVGVCALNPHGGEGGLFGDEEATLIAPAVGIARELGIDATGPYPGDTVFLAARDGKYDAVLAMYHDQGLIPVKLLAFDQAVNITIGLPIIRTSPDHGTAFDIVGRNRANPGSMRAAVELAIDMAIRKHKREQMSLEQANKDIRPDVF